MTHRRKRIHVEKKPGRKQTKFVEPDRRNFSLWDPEDKTEQGRFYMGTGPNARVQGVAKKVATRVGGTEGNPVRIRLREWGTDFVRVYDVWRKLVPFRMTDHPIWRREGQTHYVKSFANYIGTEDLEGDRNASDIGIFTAYHLRLQDKYDRLYAEKGAEALEKEWQAWMSVEIPEWYKPGSLDGILVSDEERERASVTENLRMLRSYKSSWRKRKQNKDREAQPASDQVGRPDSDLGKNVPNSDKEETKLIAGFIGGLVSGSDKKEPQT